MSFKKAPIEPNCLFLGGTLELRIIDGEKHVENSSENVFGTGTFDSRIEIMCGFNLLGKSLIKHGMLEFRMGKRRWDGFDSTLKPMAITPSMPSVVRILIYECNREKSTDIMGEAALSLGNMVPGESYSEVAPIVRTGNVFVGGNSSNVGTLHVRCIFIPNLPSIIGADTTVRIPTNIVNNRGKFAIGVGYTTVLSDRISTSLVMFNSEGSYVDAVSLNKRDSTKGLVASYEEVVPHKGFLRDKHEISFELAIASTPDSVKAIFLVISDYTEFGSLENLKDIYVRLKENKCKRELYRFPGLVIDKPATSGVLLRLVRDEADPKVRESE
jgi:hypothetical protein